MGKNNKKGKGKSAQAANSNDPDALKVSPAHPQANLEVQNCGNESFSKGNYEEALNYYTRAIELND
jgi:tetratricopeptide (TPR) repeat protein